MKTRQIVVCGLIAAILVLVLIACPESESEPEHVHQWGEWSITTPATCITVGEKTRTCTIDATHKETEEIPVNPDAHNYQWEVKITATCKSEGEEAGICTRDLTHKTTRIIPIDLINGHNWSEWEETKIATEAEDGEETRTCSHDATHKEAHTLYATGTIELAFELSYGNVYSVSEGSVSSGVVYIPAYHRPDADSQYLPVTKIQNGAFYDIAITAVNILEGVTSIGFGAFKGCNSLTSVTIPASVEYIEEWVFEACTSLTNITIDANNPNFSSKGGILYNKAKTTLISYPSASGNINIIEGVTSIGKSAFRMCTDLTGVSIPSTVTEIGSQAFGWCTGLISINIPEGIMFIGIEAFKNSTNITNINIPASVTFIGSWAFEGWTNSQIINILGHANQSSADAAWRSETGLMVWRRDCNAIINYLGS